MNAVIIDCFDTYGERVRQIKKSLEENHFEVSVCISDFKHIEKKYIEEAPKNYKLFHALPYYSNISISRIKSHLYLSKEIFSYIKENAHRIDLLWVLIPPNKFAVDAARIKEIFPNIKVVMDIIDLWPETMPLSKVRFTPPYIMWINERNKALEAANYIVCECGLYEKKLCNVLQNKKHKIIYLCKDEQASLSNVSIPDDSYVLCYLGSMNNIIDIDAISFVIKELSKKKYVQIHLIGDGEKKHELLTACTNAGAIVFDHGKVYDHDQKNAIMQKCHYGLNMMKSSVVVGLTMKSMDYMEAGLPLINNIKGDTWDNVAHYNLGYNIDALSSLDINQNNIQRENIINYYNNHLTYPHFKNSIDEVIDQLFEK